MRIRRALLSVADKSGITDLAKCLARHEVEIISTGGTAAVMKKAGIKVTEVSDVTGMGESLGGRLKTLHPAVLGGMLHDRDVEGQQAELEALGGRPIDLVVVNFYDFAEAVAAEKDMAELVEKIDIGGPTMVRSAAKNHKHVAVVVDPDDYVHLARLLDKDDCSLDEEELARLAAKAFVQTSTYDAAIGWALHGAGVPDPGSRFSITGSEPLRYGENPHQEAVVHVADGEIRQLGGPQLSYNNIQDAAFAWRTVHDHDGPACGIVKHAIPCGVAVADSPKKAYMKALSADPTSAYGGVVACNRELDFGTLELMRKTFLEVIVFPSYDKQAEESLRSARRLRSIYGPIGVNRGPEGRSLGGVSLLQQRDDKVVTAKDLDVVTREKPTDAMVRELLFAWNVVKHTRSNAVVVTNGRTTVGIGAGQTSRVEAAEIAIARARNKGHEVLGSVAASDAFFPFPDGVATLAEAGVAAIVQPGGSKRDKEVIEAADSHGIVMVFTGVRHFSH